MFYYMIDKNFIHFCQVSVYEMLVLLASSQEHFGSHNAIETVIGEPDRIFYNDDHLLLLVIEVKTKYTLPIIDDNDLVRKFNEDTQVHDQNIAPINSTLYQVQQIFGYLSCNCLQYGVLTTYEQTWFLKRDLGKLYISPAIRYNNQDQHYSIVMHVSWSLPAEIISIHLHLHQHNQTAHLAITVILTIVTIILRKSTNEVVTTLLGASTNNMMGALLRASRKKDVRAAKGVSKVVDELLQDNSQQDFL